MINPLKLITRLASPALFPQKPARWLAPVLAVVGWLAMASPALADVNLRSSFPGRRVGGGTRGECTARLVAHLVPKFNVFAPGSSGLVAILQGPSANLSPLIVAFKPANSTGVVQPGASLLESRELPPAPVGLVLLKAPSSAGVVQWESSYRCDGGVADTDPLNFVSAGAPPAVSLLVKAAEPVDRLIQAELAQWKTQCGGTIAREQVAKTFGLDELLGPDWPAQLPLRCL
jgi:hypothetical protein